MTGTRYRLTVLGAAVLVTTVVGAALWRLSGPSRRASPPAPVAGIEDVRAEGWLTRARRYREKDLADSTPMLRADGSVSTRIPAQAAEAVPNRDPQAIAREERILNTRSGVRGRDY